MINATVVNKFKVSIKYSDENVDTMYFPKYKPLLDFLNEVAKDDSNIENINIAKLMPMDYIPHIDIAKIDPKENLWMGELVHFHNLPNQQNVKGTLYARRFIMLNYTSDMKPENRTMNRYVLHMFLPENTEKNTLEYLDKVSTVNIVIYSTDENFENTGTIRSITVPFQMQFLDSLHGIGAYEEGKTDYHEELHEYIEELISFHIKITAAMFNPFAFPGMMVKTPVEEKK